MAKQAPDLRIDRMGTHLFQVTRKDGSNFLRWDWNKLLEEVRVATSGVPAKAKAEPKKKTTAKKDLVKETEAKVTKSRAKKVVTDQITDAVTTKKPTAKKKPAAKKSAK